MVRTGKIPKSYEKYAKICLSKNLKKPASPPGGGEQRYDTGNKNLHHGLGSLAKKYFMKPLTNSQKGNHVDNRLKIRIGNDENCTKFLKLKNGKRYAKTAQNF